MRLFRTPVGQLTPESIEVLVREHVSESRRLDFKRAVPTSDAEKADLVNDVCSFANTDGGVVLLGIDERGPDGAKTGQAQQIVGIEGTADDATLRLTQALESKITPSIGRLLRFQAVAIDASRTVLALGIAQSYARPHREENRRRYWLRNDGGKYEPDVAELRRMFSESESWSEEADTFIDKRTRILGGLTFDESAFVAVHVLPLGRLRSQLDLSSMYERAASIVPSGGSSMTVRPNLEGVIGRSTSYNDPTVLIEQVQIFRFGGIEFASTRAVSSDAQRGRQIFGDLLTRNVREVIRNAVRELGDVLDVDAPFALGLTLSGAAGFAFVRSDLHRFEALEVPNDALRIPSVVYEPGGDLDLCTRQLTDVLWQAAGARVSYWPEDGGQNSPHRG